jgi:hypothetical protein
MAKRRLVVLIILLICGSYLAGSVWASNGIAIARSVIAGGGEQVTDGSLFILNGTLGEPIVNALTLETDYGLSSGFWWWPGEFKIYLPLVVKD